MKENPFKFRPYHNPANADESRVPEGWRFRYADEIGKPAKTLCRRWWPYLCEFSLFDNYLGLNLSVTYIVPVTP